MPSNLSQLVLKSSSAPYRIHSSSDSQERLAKVRLDPIRLMMYIMVIRIVREGELARIPPQLISAVIIDGLDRTEREEEKSLANSHRRYFLSDYRAKSVEDESLDRMIV